METCVFSKHLQDYGFPELGRAVKKIGVEAVDLTVRPEGHVLPETVREKLPQAVSALKAEGVRVAMITTAITSVDEPHTRAVLETAAAEGIRYYKLGYYRYEGLGTLRRGLSEAKAKLRDVAAMSKELGICGGYHNHSGGCIGALLPHVRELIEDLDPDAVCAYYDIGHATVEGTAAGWVQGLDDLGERVRMLAFKDLQVGPAAKDGRKVVPMGEGVVRWDEFVSALKSDAFQIGPASFHAEYHLPADEVVETARRDKAFFDGLWDRSS